MNKLEEKLDGNDHWRYSNVGPIELQCIMLYQIICPTKYV